MKFVSVIPFDLQRRMGLLIQGHDQLVAECPASEAERVAAAMKWAMVRTIGPMRFPAEVKIDTNWKDAS